MALLHLPLFNKGQDGNSPPPLPLRTSASLKLQGIPNKFFTAITLEEYDMLASVAALETAEPWDIGHRGFTSHLGHTSSEYSCILRCCDRSPPRIDLTVHNITGLRQVLQLG